MHAAMLGCLCVRSSLLELKCEIYINISDDDALPVGVEKVVAFGIATYDFCDSPFHLREAGKDMLCGRK